MVLTFILAMVEQGLRQLLIWLALVFLLPRNVRMARDGWIGAALEKFEAAEAAHNEETLGSVHNYEKSRFMLSAWFVLDLTRIQAAQVKMVF